MIEYRAKPKEEAEHSEGMVVSIGRMKVCVMKRCGHMQTTTPFSRYGIWRVDLALEHIMDPSHAAIVKLFFLHPSGVTLAC